MREQAFRQGRVSRLDDLIFAIRMRRILPHIHGLDRVVADFGSGYDAAFLSRLLASGKTSRAIAVDLALDPSIASDQLALVEADLNGKLPLADASVDIATSLAVLEHLDRPDVHARELFRVLKPGGTLLLTTPSPLGKPVLEFLAYRLKVIDRAEIDDHKRYFDGALLRQTLVHAGFSDENISHKTFLFGMNNFIHATKTS